MRRYIGITGTPGTGKKSVALLLGRRMALPTQGLNDLAFDEGLISGGAPDSNEVHPSKLRRALLGSQPGRCIVYGHLLPAVLRSADAERVVVLRCDPRALKKRLGQRGYAGPKLRANVEAELIGLIYSESVSRFGKSRTIQFDTTAAKPDGAAGKVEKLLSAGGRGASNIDWLPAYASAEKLRSLLSAESTDSALT